MTESTIKLTIEEQSAILMHGAQFGDGQIEETMRQGLCERLTEARMAGRPLRVYCGYDPTAPDIHLGHTVTMRKLRQFQDLGHHVIFLIGTFTGLVGDPSDKDRARPQRTAEALGENARTYTQQAFRILDREKTEVRYNADWLARLTFEDVIGLASHFTVQQFLARDNFSERHRKGDPIWLHEFYYALMQAYDAVALRADVQLGATEQLFNLLAGRRLQEAHGHTPQICLTFPILVGTDGVLRMSKSTGNYVGIDEPPDIKYGKTMSIPDSAMRNWFELVTRWKPDQIESLLTGVADGRVHPMEVKKRLAWEIVSIFDGDEAANLAAERFARVHQRRETPRDMPTYVLTVPTNVVEIIQAVGFTQSKSEARRLVQQGAVKLDGESVETVEAQAIPGGEQVLQVGKRRFLRLVAGVEP
ncbi:MAG: tyrosine--tRNA ligase [Chloroflexi bacterium]|nr:tyrosine--tRNA ligase [Chloroflexota bacterium]